MGLDIFRDYDADGAIVLLSSGSRKFSVELVQDPCVSVGLSYMETGSMVRFRRRGCVP